jgi:hypothetical protein
MLHQPRYQLVHLLALGAPELVRIVRCRIQMRVQRDERVEGAMAEVTFVSRAVPRLFARRVVHRLPRRTHDALGDTNAGRDALSGSCHLLPGDTLSTPISLNVQRQSRRRLERPRAEDAMDVTSVVNARSAVL